MFTRELPNEYRSREPTLEAWIALGYQRDTVTRLLSMMKRAFRISETDAFRLRPGDEVWALYNYYYPSATGTWRQFDMRPDELEIEHWQKTFGRLSADMSIYIRH
jgi:hypothetical protein